MSSAASIFTPISAEIFNGLSPAQQRVAIARDVIARMDADLLVAGRGYTLSDETRHLLRSQPDSAAVRDAINSRPCVACAKGAMLMSWIGTLNSVEPEDASSAMAGALDTSFPEPMVALFGHRRLNAIEVAYEWDVSYARHRMTNAEAQALLNLGEEVDRCDASTRTSRLRALMENLIANEGDLVISDGNGGTYRFGDETAA